MHFVVSSKYFEMAVMLVICLSSIALAAEDPVNDKSERNFYLNQIDIAFTVVFAIEMVLKVRSITDNLIPHGQTSMSSSFRRW